MATSSEGKILQHTRHGLRMVGKKASFFDLPEPIWHPDEKSAVCDNCKNKFTITHRRHHCRRCGSVICSDCSEKQTLRRMGFVDPVLVCLHCARLCQGEEEFYKHHLKILENGAYFELSDADGIHNCKLSSDHFQIIVTGGSGSHPSLLMSSIMEIKSITGHAPDGTPTNKLNGLKLTYRSDTEDGEEIDVTLSPSPSHSRKQSIDWLKGLKKGLMIIHARERGNSCLVESN
ncbi:PREDICTED: zinc finger FYVE domain-containing protein 21-like [Amphimedon queenslandica]|uniref:FYVE-type domain-containing protein n=1 Tax=Amphimedon queenslandica TaxID=400682 RepID=A0A1X7V3I2_AMPQE|nr:PREDICTED: zinc finger FYVE domain-containing protein 21-like [Amphimedon queenslandica]|eukprot:XP_003385759.1 PREDICTED: zinc finger FYVE domain-containing protein 21-like [Amphimedon queenslandica]